MALDVGSLIPHGAVRAYVMGERGAKNQPATEDDIEAMARIVREGMQAGALGFSTSRTIAHMAIDGEPVPGTFAAEAELFGIGRVLGDLGAGVFELAPAGALGEDLAAPEREMDWMRRLGAAIGRPVTFALTQNDHDPKAWRRMLDLSGQAAADGAAVRPQVAGRPVSLLLGLHTFHPFAYCPSWSEIGLLPVAERAARMADPDLKARLLAEAEKADPMLTQFLDPERVFPVDDVPNYEPDPSSSIAARARSAGRVPLDVFYEDLRADAGEALLLRPLLNYSDFNLDAVREMLLHPTSAWGLGDGGAHCGTTCDASTPTYMLAHWARDRDHDRLPVEWIVRKMTRGHRSALRAHRSRHVRARHARRREPRRLRQRRAPSAGTRARSTRRRAALHPAQRRLGRNGEARRGRSARRRGPGRPPRRPAAWRGRASPMNRGPDRARSHPEVLGRVDRRMRLATPAQKIWAGAKRPPTRGGGATLLAMGSALVLNATYEPLAVVPSRRAAILVLAEKADILDLSGQVLHSERTTLPLPSVIRLRYFVRVPYHRNVALSRRGVFARDGHSCQYCGNRAETLDHVVPRSRGGLHTWDNVVAACRRCNVGKADRLLHETRFSLRVPPVAPRQLSWVLVSVGRVPSAWEPYLARVAA